MSYSLISPCNNFPSTNPNGQGDCIHKDTCVDKRTIEDAISSLYCVGVLHKGGGTITIDCCNKRKE